MYSRDTLNRSVHRMMDASNEGNPFTKQIWAWEAKRLAQAAMSHATDGERALAWDIISQAQSLTRTT